ncbi:hypothetical protein DEF23_01330 [Marinitenerispora sediminis]|uniref:Uncharacterized protein n=1 Tax=Marinitenerispora sediminis TaxID=1931232 RepID=A0A368T8S2_9ACTN|nr:hypothetical protein DEF28_05890 [Marinitenerispora sediminis]RCV60793.1 hypothetical protein DEF24_06100 [Marinitenerispora sediminis]RCV61744.1 hypothetical protein DEF23_01330 [Marinitenerispora sediminis]
MADDEPKTEVVLPKGAQAAPAPGLTQGSAARPGTADRRPHTRLTAARIRARQAARRRGAESRR